MLPSASSNPINNPVLFCQENSFTARTIGGSSFTPLNLYADNRSPVREFTTSSCGPQAKQASPFFPRAKKKAKMFFILVLYVHNKPKQQLTFTYIIYIAPYIRLYILSTD